MTRPSTATTNSDDGTVKSKSNPNTNNNNTNNGRLRVILVRHGESQNNIYDEISKQVYEANRVCDPSLTDRGQQHAQHVAAYLASNTHALLDVHNLHAVYVSPMRRTMQTAMPIVEALRKVQQTQQRPLLPVHVWTDIFEISGVYDNNVGQPGMTRSEMQQQFPLCSLPDTVTETGWYDVSLGRETNDHGKQRCQQVWNRLVTMAQTLPNQDSSFITIIVLVTHGDFMDHLLQAALGVLQIRDAHLEPREKITVKMFPSWNGSMTALEIPAGGSSNSNNKPNNKRPTILFHNAVSHLPPHLVKTDKLGKC